MTFKYKAVTEQGEKKEGTIEAVSKDLAIVSLQRRGLVILSIVGGEDKKGIFSGKSFERVAMREVVITSRQIATLFEAQVSALKAFSLLAANAENKFLAYT